MQNSPTPTSLLVADAGPLIALARLNRLDLPAAYYSKILVPAAVLKECLAGTHGAEEIARAVQNAPWEIVSTEGSCSLPAPSSLGEGEAAAISLANAYPGATVFIDDWVGRRVAKSLGLPVIGVLGLLVAARRQGKIGFLRPVLDQLQQTGYRLAPSLVTEVLRTVGEE